MISRITMTGFKSFAAKTTLEFGSGMTAVVGPNGSGKSNLADAVRWVMGEQSKSKLRLDGREEVIFAGTAERPPASYAEVVLVFDNRDGRFALDRPEVELSRRLYRSGESEYRLAGRTAKLADIQSLLAGAGVSPGSYSVIGQGMVDSLLLSGPAERKQLFDEAAGIRGAELNREAAIRKLTATTTNLVRLRDIAGELTPRLQTLERVVATAQQQVELSQRVTQLRQQLAAARLASAATALAEAQAARVAAERGQTALQAEEAKLASQLDSHREARQTAAARQQAALGELTQLEQQRAQLEDEARHLQNEADHLARLAAAEPALAEQITQQHQRVTAAGHRVAELTADLASNQTSLDRAAKAVERAGREVSAAQQALVALREEHTDSTRDQYLNHALEIIKLLANGLNDHSLDDQAVQLLVHKAGRLLSHAARRGADELVAALQAAQQRLEATMGRRDIVMEHQTNVTITRRSLEIDLTHQTELAGELQADLDNLESQHNQAGQAAHQAEALAGRLAAARQQLAGLDDNLHRQRQALAQPATQAVDVEAEAATATALERCRQQLGQTRRQLEAAESDAAAATAARDAAMVLARSWQLSVESLETSTEQTRRPIAELATALTTAEATLAARSNAQDGQLEEYQQVKQRHDELTGQIADLEQAQTDLDAVIRQLDGLIRARFKDNMKTLATQFSDYFGQLFPGGTASLTLEAQGAEGYGVLIKASPAGKRLSNLTALSGGERTLTGIALLAAILRVTPSPFIVLDEVDAALDEANSGRLAGIFAELASQSQLIVITHNRQTMQAARLLYGVTVTPKHATHVLPLRLEEATAIAAR